ncbi:SLC13 family permease [Fusibacter tunisiensis]|uniref:Di/tricarboxylate transporter n=1 Tax=Fusibacter tunisiensis TaxID=1008308 RepID=A0ABS2MU11_9FIRM|nr:SLC13 family permease [Fusibacter tunisiensis]MBM7562931.1 di/tricarboxylate transporter [Fusibacter tunisiensis]
MQQYLVFAIIGFSLFLFVDGRLRYDFVALLGLILLVLIGAIDPSDTFNGFSQPAVITVAAVLVISNALIRTGAIDFLVIYLNHNIKSLPLKLLSLTAITAIVSAFMNNVGALALIMPIAIKVAKESEISPSKFLMPVAFASLLGGMMTEIGTPPNLIISGFREEALGEPFAFFDFFPVGIGITLIGLLFLSLFGARLTPNRSSSFKQDLFNIENYLSEVLVTNNCKAIGKTLRDFQKIYNLEINVISVIRNDKKIIAPLANEQMLLNDILIVKAYPSELAKLIEKTGLILIGAKTNLNDTDKNSQTQGLAFVEIVLREDSPLIGRTAMDIQLRNRYNVNLIAISRKGTPAIRRLKSFRFKSGDILLIQTTENSLNDTYAKLRCLPLAERGVSMTSKKNAKEKHLTLFMFVAAIALTALEIFPVQIVFVATALSYVILGILTPREFYEAIEWPTIIMLGALLQYGEALQLSGGADTIAKSLVYISKFMPNELVLFSLMFFTILLTNLINNSAAAILMAPIALSLSQFMGVSPDPLLMGVCVASSSAFMTPIGHQSNMLVMGPGGYHFRDYAKLGFPLTLLILIVGAPLILFFWPL